MKQYLRIDAVIYFKDGVDWNIADECVDALIGQCEKFNGQVAIVHDIQDEEDIENE
jgi:hypothetical protein